jgi:outer membrane protein insertion porin family
MTVTSLVFAYQLDTRFDQTNPHSGVRANLGFELAEKLLGTDFRFRRLLADVRWLTAPLRENVLAFQVRAGFSWGRVPAQRKYSAGGYYGVRGVPESEALGLQTLVLRAEYRHLLLHDLDLNFFWFGWVRRVQGALFLETGIAADRARDLFRANDFVSGAGYGLRVEFSAFGVRSFLVGVDAGWRFDDVGAEPVLYLTASQSF